MPARFVPSRDAEQTITDLALPYCAEVANMLTGPIIGNVPVVHGVVVRSYRPTVEQTPEGARWYPGSPFWHWLEYGTAYSAPYRPIASGVASLGLRFEAT